MARVRRGLGKGTGKGYRNIIGKDPMVHRQSAKGMKQPQRVSELKLRYNDPHFVPYSDNLVVMKGHLLETKEDLKRMPSEVTIMFDRPEIDSDGDGFPDFVDCRPFNPRLQREEEIKEVGDMLEDVETEEKKSGFRRFAEKTGKSLLEAGKKGEKFAEEKFKESKEKRRKKKVEAFAEVSHPVARQIQKQEDRVSQIESDLKITDDTEDRRRILDELLKEKEELRELQDKFTEINIADLSDNQLKKLAVRHKDDSFFAGLLGGSGNPYKDEVIRRIREKKKLEKEIRDANKKPVEEDTGFF